MENIIRRLYSLHAPCLLVLVWAAVLLLTTQQEMLYAAQDLSGWQPEWNPDACLHQSGGLLVWLSGWLTQLFYYPWLGVGVLCLLWGAGYLAAAWGLALHPSLRWLALLPVLGLVAGITQTGYWLYTLRLPAYFFLPTLWYVWVAVLLVLVRLFHYHHWSPLFCVLLGILLVEWLCLVSPWCGFAWHPFDGDPMMLARPWYFAIVTSVLAAFLALLRRPVLPQWMSWPVLMVCMALTYFFSCYRNPNFRAELQQQRDFESAHWSSLISSVSNASRTPTRQMILLADAARMHRDYQPGDSVTFGANEGVKPRQYSDPPIHMAQMGGPAVYLAFGYANYSYRWSFENAVEYGFSPQRLRMMCYCALLNGEEALAHKYADMLARYPFHRHTAQHLLSLIGHPDRQAADPLLGQLQPWLLHDDALTFDGGKPEKFLLRNLPHTHRVTWHYSKPTELVFY